jgi:predicted HTH transcriptional regulator
MTFDRPLSQVDKAALETLRTDAVCEGRQLDYKEQLPGGSDDDRREFLSDVASFANAAGGDIIFGIRERRDEQGKATGEPDTLVGITGLNLDSVRLQLENIIRDGIAPRIAGVIFHEIPRSPDPPCLLLRVPRSWIGPHMVIFKNLSRFFSRNSGGKYQLDVGEIRIGFLAAETAN